MTVYLVRSLPKIAYTHCIYMVLANPSNVGIKRCCRHSAAEHPKCGWTITVLGISKTRGT